MKSKTITNADLQRGEGKLQSLANKLFGKDEEGKPNVRVHADNRTTGRFPTFVQLPGYGDDRLVDNFRRLEAAAFNLSCAQSEWNTAFNGWESVKRHGDDTAILRAEVSKTLGRLPTLFSDSFELPPRPSRWHKWEVQIDGEENLACAKLEYNQSIDEKIAVVKEFVRARRLVLIKTFGAKNIQSWLVSISGGSNVYLYALVETPKKDRPLKEAIRKARFDFMEKHKVEIELAVQEELKKIHLQTK